MKLKLLSTILLVMILLPILVLAADPIQNPSPDRFVDLTRFGLQNNFQGLLQFFVERLLQVAGIIAILFLIIGGYQYITSGANQEMAETGKRTIQNAIIGIVIIILSYTIVVVIFQSLS